MRTGESSENVQQDEYSIAGSPMFIPASLSFASISTLLVFGPGVRDASEGSTPKSRNSVPIVQMIAVWGLVKFWLADRIWSDDL